MLFLVFLSVTQAEAGIPRVDCIPIGGTPDQVRGDGKLVSDHKPNTILAMILR
jgi:hypothetical protein